MTDAMIVMQDVLCQSKGGCSRRDGGYCDNCRATAQRIHNGLEALAIERVLSDPSRLTPAMATRIIASALASDEAKAVAMAVLERRKAA